MDDTYEAVFASVLTKVAKLHNIEQIEPLQHICWIFNRPTRCFRTRVCSKWENNSMPHTVCKSHPLNVIGWLRAGFLNYNCHTCRPVIPFLLLICRQTSWRESTVCLERLRWLYLIFTFSDVIDINPFLECRGKSWLQVCQIVNLSELPLWIYMSLYASTPRRTGLIFNMGSITLYINFTTFAVKYFYARIHVIYGRP